MKRPPTETLILYSYPVIIALIMGFTVAFAVGSG